MGIREIRAIRAIGPFLALEGRGDALLARLTTIHGPNGHGKTTLAAVLRSLATRDPTAIAERATLGRAGETEATIALAGGEIARFAGGAWSTTGPWPADDTGLEIFDSTFVTDNVHGGEQVGSAQRRHLYQVVVGAAAVALVRQIDGHDARAREAGRTLAASEAGLRALIDPSFPLESFVALAADVDVEAELRAVGARLAVARRVAEVMAGPDLDELDAPEPPADLLALLARAIAAPPLCPTCGHAAAAAPPVDQPVAGPADRQAEVAAVERAWAAVEHDLGEPALAACRDRVVANDARIERWRDLVELGGAAWSFARLERAWRELVERLREPLARKRACPGLAVDVPPALTAAVVAHADAVAELRAHNFHVRAANRRLAALRQRATQAPIAELEAQLRRLRHVQLRATPEADALVERLLAARSHKLAHDQAAQRKRAELEAMAQTALATYEAAINRRLLGFGASFALTGTRPSFVGGRASSTYQLALRDGTLALGDDHTPRGTPCFRTALGTGDRSALAIAFFLARLERDPGLDRKTLVVDEPATGLDRRRRAYVVQAIRRLAAVAAQTIVLSHDASLLDQLCADVEPTAVARLELARVGSTSTLRPWRAPPTDDVTSRRSGPCSPS